MNLFEKLRERGFETVPQSFYGSIEVWKSWYRGDVEKFHRYRVYNGQSHVLCRRWSMGMAKKVAEDWANLLMNEKAKVTLEGEKEQAFFDRVCRENNFRVKASEMQEMKAALGTAAYVLRAVGVQADGETGRLSGPARGLRIDYCTAENIFPLSWENGRATECAFSAPKTLGGEKYLYVQLHRLGPDGTYDIENLLYRDRDGNLTETEPGTVPGFETMPAVVHTGSREPQFVLDRLNLANNADISLPMGIAVYANAIDQLMGVDVAYDSYVNEFVLGKKRILVQPEATKDLDGEPVFDANDLAFYVLPEDRAGESLIKEIDMSLRTGEHRAGIQDMLNSLSAKCGFGENHYRFDREGVLTATQVVSENSTLFRTVKKHEIVLEQTLRELARCILRMGNAYMNAGLDEDVEISVDFDDSIIEDKGAEFARDMQMLSAGVLAPWELRAKWLNEDEATAKAALAETGRGQKGFV